VEFGFVSSSSPKKPCLLNLLNSPSKNSKLTDRLSIKLRTVGGRRRIDCLRRRSGDWLRRKKFGDGRRRKKSGDGRRRQNRGGRRRRNRRRGLRRPKGSTQDRRS
jgi:hypothetical protein